MIRKVVRAHLFSHNKTAANISIKDYLISIICWHTVKRFQIFLSNTDNSIYQVFLCNMNNLHIAIGFQMINNNP